MKKFYTLLQNRIIATAITVLFAISVYAIRPIATSMGRPYVTLFCWMLTVSGTVLFLALLWYLLAKWEVNRGGYLIAVGSAGLFGVIIGLATLLRLEEVLSDALYWTLISGSRVMFIGIMWGLVKEWVIRPMTSE